MSRLFATIAAALLSFQLAAQPFADSLELSKMPSCARPELSVLTFPAGRAAQNAFYAKLDSIAAGRHEAVNIWHVGGSHVQAAVLPERIMYDLGSLPKMQNADRGFFFPKRLAATNGERGYRFATEGSWEAPMLTKSSKVEKPRYGITGFGARTSDSTAGVTLYTDADSTHRWEFNRLRVLGYGSSSGTYPYVLKGADTLSFVVDPATSSYVFGMGGFVDSVKVCFNIPEGETFVLNGLEPMAGQSGINYFASGVNGASVTSWADQCVDLQRDLQLVRPDLVIFGLGINDSATTAKLFKPEKFKANYRRLVAMIQKVSPDCAFIFLTNNDSYRYVKRGMTYNENAVAVRTAMMELAEEFGGCVWDLYGVMGGAHTVLKWRDAGLIKPDKLHFTEEGYTLIADMICDAIVDDRLKNGGPAL